MGVQLPFQKNGYFLELTDAMGVDSIEAGELPSLVGRIANAFQDNYRERLNAAKECSRVLDRGFWVAADYIRLIRDLNLVEKKTYLQRQNAFSHPFNFTVEATRRSTPDSEDYPSSYIKKMIPLSGVLNSFFSGRFCFIDSGEFVGIVHLFALYTLFGKGKFNSAFDTTLPFFAKEPSQSLLAPFLEEHREGTMRAIGKLRGSRLLETHYAIKRGRKFIGLETPKEGFDWKGYKDFIGGHPPIPECPSPFKWLCAFLPFFQAQGEEMVLCTGKWRLSPDRINEILTQQAFCSK